MKSASNYTYRQTVAKVNELIGTTADDMNILINELNTRLNVIVSKVNQIVVKVNNIPGTPTDDLENISIDENLLGVNRIELMSTEDES